MLKYVQDFHDLHKLNLLQFFHSIFYFNQNFFYKYYNPLLHRHNYRTRNTSVRLNMEKQFA